MPKVEELHNAAYNAVLEWGYLEHADSIIAMQARIEADIFLHGEISEETKQLFKYDGERDNILRNVVVYYTTEHWKCTEPSLVLIKIMDYLRENDPLTADVLDSHRVALAKILNNLDDFKDKVECIAYKYASVEWEVHLMLMASMGSKLPKDDEVVQLVI